MKYGIGFVENTQRWKHCTTYHINMILYIINNQKHILYMAYLPK